MWCGVWAMGMIGPFIFENCKGAAVTVNGERYRHSYRYRPVGYGLSLKILIFLNIFIFSRIGKHAVRVYHTIRETVALFLEKFLR